MTPKEYFRKIIELYEKSRIPQFYNPNIQRGRSASISSELEDLTALFIALNNPNQCNYFIDQPMKFLGSTTKYPDIVIQKTDGVIDHLIDVKTDLGWNRNGIYAFCDKWEKAIAAVKGKETSFKSDLENWTRVWSSMRLVPVGEIPTGRSDQMLIPKPPPLKDKAQAPWW